MCVTCGCSDGAQTTYTRPGQDNEQGMNHHSHTHVLEDGTVITHTHETDHTPSHPTTSSANHHHPTTPPPHHPQ